jgi:hypothetical protein
MNEPSPKQPHPERSFPARQSAIPRSSLRIPMPAGVKPPRPEAVEAKPAPKPET